MKVIGSLVWIMDVHCSVRSPFWLLICAASTSPNLKFTSVVANDVLLEGETKEDNQILLLKSRKLSLFFVSEDEDETLWPSELLYANSISEDEYHASKTPLLQRLKVQGAKIDPKDVVIAGPKHKDPNNECSVIDLQDSGSKNKLKQQNSGIKQVNGVASVLGPSSSSSFKNGIDNSVGMSHENPFWNCQLKEKDEKPTIPMAESVVNEDSAK
ncbi:hypothetical protein Tco_0322774 [Tanacetum coccineum]